jgi:hypothetical protein
VIQARGVPGFDAWLARARFEADSRGLVFETMSSWSADQPAVEPAKGKRPRGRPRRRPAEGEGEDGAA